MKFWASSVSFLPMSLCALHAAARDPMAAEVLFDEAVLDMKAGRFVEACPKVAESQRLEPRSGTLFTLGECWALAGRPATAIARYREYLRVYGRMSDTEQAAQRGREKIAAERIAELDLQVPKLRVLLRKPVPTGTVVTRDSVELGTPSLGAWLPLDPGTHVIVARAPGGPPVEAKFELALGERRTVELTVKSPTLKSPPKKVVPKAEPVSLAPSGERRAAGMSGLQVGAIGAGVVALVGVAVGVTTGMMVLNRKDALKEQCGIGGDPSACTPEGETEGNSIKALATVSTISFVVGGAAAGVSIGLLLIDRPSKSSAMARWSSPKTPVLSVSGSL